MTVGRRELAAAVAIPIVLSVLFFLPPLAFNLLVAAVTLAALWEFYRLAEKAGLPVAKTAGMFFGAAFLLGWAALWGFDVLDRPGRTVVLGALLVLVGLACLAQLFAKVELPVALGGASRIVSSRAVLLLFLLVWGCDSFAYYIGKNFGRVKLAPSVSPNKTWEGTIGGLIGSTLVGAAAGTWWVFPELGEARGALAGALATSAGQLGDLVESLW